MFDWSINEPKWNVSDPSGFSFASIDAEITTPVVKKENIPINNHQNTVFDPARILFI